MDQAEYGTNFLVAVEIVLKEEGGYVDHPDDPGGATNWGISLRFLKNLFGRGDLDRDGDIDASDIRAMTREDAMEFYHEEFWFPAKLDRLPLFLAISIFDAAVNQGRGRAIKWLQEILGVKADGVIGPVTLQRLQKSDPTKLFFSFVLKRFVAYQQTKNFNIFGDGWTNRIINVHAAAIKFLFSPTPTK